MPTTYNGVGTTYAGKKNVTTRRTVCSSCGREAMMESYDTRLFFCFLFIPLIPLKRVRVLDMCPSCRVHRTVHPAEYEAGRQLHVSGALEEFRKQPTPANAVKVHAAMLAFHENDRALEFRTGADDMLGKDAQSMADIGSQLLQTSQADAAGPYFERAHVLRPDLPQARIGLALRRLNEARLDEAHSLLDFMEKPGSSQLYDLKPLLMLAERYHATGRRAEALGVYKFLLTELPHLNQNRHIRGVVQQLEKSVGDGSLSVLPKQPFSIRKIFSKDSQVNHPMVRMAAWVGVVAICGAIIALVFNEHQRRHRVLHVIGGLSGTVEVSLDGGPPVKLARGSRDTIDFIEGEHHISVTGAVQQNHQVSLTTPYMSRWGNDPVWILNVDQAAPVVRYAMFYSENESGRDVVPDVDVLYKEPVSFVPHVDYAFKQPPETIHVESRGDKRIVKQCLKVEDSWQEAAEFLYSAGKAEQALDLLKWCALSGKGGGETITLYVQLATLMKRDQEAWTALEKEVEKTPLQVDLHRLMQERDSSPAQVKKLSDLYASVLKQNPKDAAALYLSGRIAADPKEAVELFTKAREADPSSPWPSLALAYHAAGRAEWEKAATLMEHYVKQKPDDVGGRDFFFECNLGSGQMDEALKSMNARARSKDIHEAERATLNLVLIYALKKEREKAEAAVRKLIAHGRSVAEPDYKASDIVLMNLAYAFGDFDGLLETARNAGDEHKGFVFAAYCEKHQLTEAISLVQVEKFPLDPLTCLALTAVADIAGNGSESTKWREKAISMFEETKDQDHAAIAALLKMETLPSLDPVMELSWTAREKSLLCVVLASRHPDKRTELLGLARKLNVVPIWPYHLVHGVTGES